MTERDGPMTPNAFHALFGRIGARAKMPFPIHPHMMRHGCGYALANAGHDFIKSGVTVHAKRPARSAHLPDWLLVTLALAIAHSPQTWGSKLHKSRNGHAGDPTSLHDPIIDFPRILLE